MADLLEVRDLSLQFGGITALQGVGVAIAEGEAIARFIAPDARTHGARIR